MSNPDGRNVCSSFLFFEQLNGVFFFFFFLGVFVFPCSQCFLFVCMFTAVVSGISFVVDWC